eukprot:scaffold374330_cov19-Prasinocladus_malaysianus.AAC.1
MVYRHTVRVRCRISTIDYSYSYVARIMRYGEIVRIMQETPAGRPVPGSGQFRRTVPLDILRDAYCLVRLVRVRPLTQRGLHGYTALFLLAAPSYGTSTRFCGFVNIDETSYGESPTAPALVFSFGSSHLFWLSSQATSSRCISDTL